MPNSHPKNAGKPWTVNQIAQLKRLVKQNTPTRVAAIKLERTPQAVYNKASELDLSLKPVNQSPYNRQNS